MSTQITVRLPEEVVAYLDEKVRTGQATSRANALSATVQREQRREQWERDAAIYASLGGEDPELAGAHDWQINSLRNRDLSQLD